MRSTSTLPVDTGSRELSVGTLEVEVLEGPDAGARAKTADETLTVGTAEGNDLRLADQTISRYHVELERRIDGVLVRDLDSTNGTWLGSVRVMEVLVPSGTAIQIGRSHIRVGEGQRMAVPLHQGDSLGRLRGRSEAMRRLMAQIDRASKIDAAVLIVGESGTGKELIAQALHDSGARSHQPFVTVDCGALSPNLIASELFGHERGAFTGADRQHVGAFERANGGTLFLDEIGELPAELQPNLLGALERRRFRRVGGRNEISVDVRVVAATHRDLRAEVNRGHFRLDLYYRLAVVVLRVAPLRERPEDIPLLIEHFLTEAGEKAEVDAFFPSEVQAELLRYAWPGNVRELRNVVEATLAMGETNLQGLGDGAQDGSDVDDEHGTAAGPTYPKELFSMIYKDARTQLLSEFERRYIEHRLKEADGNVAKAARDAQMDRSHLFHLIRRHGLR